MTSGDLDVGLLMWDMRRRIDQQQLPTGRIVVHFQYHDAPINRSQWWLVLDQNEVDLWLVNPGVEPDLILTTSVKTMTGIWMGDISYGTALQTHDLQLDGPAKLRTRLPIWLRLSIFAEDDRQLA